VLRIITLVVLFAFTSFGLEEYAYTALWYRGTGTNRLLSSDNLYYNTRYILTNIIFNQSNNTQDLTNCGVFLNCGSMSTNLRFNATITNGIAISSFYFPVKSRASKTFDDVFIEIFATNGFQVIYSGNMVLKARNRMLIFGE
jgi:hypothetical protein